MCFTNNDGSPNMFVYQPTLDTLELKEDKSIMFLVGKEREYTILKLSHNILLFRTA